MLTRNGEQAHGNFVLLDTNMFRVDTVMRLRERAGNTGLVVGWPHLRKPGSMPQIMPIVGGSHLVTLPHSGFYLR